MFIHVCVQFIAPWQFEKDHLQKIVITFEKNRDEDINAPIEGIVSALDSFANSK